MNNPVEKLSNSLAHAAYVGFGEFEYQDRDWSEGYQRGVEPKYITKKRKHDPFDLVVYAMFLQTWGSTALGFGGIGGQAITDAYTVVIKSNRVSGYCVYFGGIFAYKISNPNVLFFGDIRAQDLYEVMGAKKRYER